MGNSRSLIRVNKISNGGFGNLPLLNLVSFIPVALKYKLEVNYGC